MTPEIPLQRDLFTGEFVDTRSSRQKQANRQPTQPYQAELFAMRDIAQFGVTAQPRLPLAPMTRLGFASQDARTEEERARDAQRAAESRTVSLFGEQSPTAVKAIGEENIPLNDFSLACLEILRQEGKEKRGSLEYYLQGLWNIWNTVRDEAIVFRANYIWAVHDEAALRITFAQRLKADGFSFDAASISGEEEPWYAAWQLALEDVEMNPPLLPSFSRQAVMTWLEA